MKHYLLTLFSFATLTLAAQNYVSKVWVADNGNGTYKNPIIFADYSDPDVCRVGDDYYMTSSSFNCVPGLPILHSKDLVNWQIINYALPRLTPTGIFNRAQHGKGVWAPSIRYHNKEFYIYWGDPEFGLYMIKTTDPAGSWSEPLLVKEGNGLIDCCPFWDEDGNAYLSHAYAGSRAGLKSVAAICKLSPDGTKVLSESKIVYDGHEKNPTLEGTKLYKRNGYYYIFAPAGGVSTGWQLVLRSKNIWGPYEEKVVMAQGKTNINGPHQGAWVDTQTGENWFIHFQDKDAYGRVVLLQPMVWKNDWPVIGDDSDGDGTGEPYTVFKKPNVGKTYPIETPVESDDFSSPNLGLQWQWHANPQPTWYFNNVAKGVLRLYSVYNDSVNNLWDEPNLLLQKFPAEEFTATCKLTFVPNKKNIGERICFVVMGEDYNLLSIQYGDKGFFLSQQACKNASKTKMSENVITNLPISSDTYYLRLIVKKGAVCNFQYSVDGQNYTPFGEEFTASPGRWIGAKMGFICERPKKSNDGGWADIDWFSVEK
jgi:beta-xylosidase